MVVRMMRMLVLVLAELLLFLQMAFAAFSCEGKISGYYADVDRGCQGYHMCDDLGRKFTYSCPNATLFQQRMLICDHWYMVDCSRAEESAHNANALIGHPGPFAGDQQLAERTARPDSAVGDLENIIYRRGRAQRVGVGGNALGDDNEVDKGVKFSFPNRKVFDGSQLSTDSSNQKSETVSPFPDEGEEFPSNIAQINASSKNYNKNREFGTRSSISQVRRTNFESDYKATTPVYPESFELPLIPSDADVGLLPPILKSLGNNRDNSGVNFGSSFKATTPAPEVEEESDFEDQSRVNFASDFKATTPVYPKTFELPQLLPDIDIGLLPPHRNGQIGVNFASSFKATTPVYPSKEELPQKDLSNVPLELIPLDLQNKFDAEQGITTTTPAAKFNVNFPSDFTATTPVYPKSFELPGGDLSNNAPDLLPPAFKLESPGNRRANFESRFKATTPVYPDAAHLPRGDLSNLPDDLQPPVPVDLAGSGRVNFESKFKATTPVYPDAAHLPKGDLSNLPNDLALPGETGSSSVKTGSRRVNFESRFQATTPVYPDAAHLPQGDLSNLPDDLLPPGPADSSSVRVNFESKFKATTPVYPDAAHLPKGDLSNLPVDLAPPQGEAVSGGVNFESHFQATTPVYPDAAHLPKGDLSNLPEDSEQSGGDIASGRVNFASRFKATTPVYPDAAHLPRGDLSNLPDDLLPPGPVPAGQGSSGRVNFESKFKATTPVYPDAAHLPKGDLSNLPDDLALPGSQTGPERVSFESNFKATTPVYPDAAHLPKGDLSNVPIGLQSFINFASDYNSTTPVYPPSVEQDLAEIGNDAGLLPPKEINDGLASSSNKQPPSLDILPPTTGSNYTRGNDTFDLRPTAPSKFFQPPKFIPDYTEYEDYNEYEAKNPFLPQTEALRSLKPSQWSEIRARYSIPDYEFPLESLSSRPGYGRGLSSYKVNMSSVGARSK